jgi:mono/diheme cytochrome c family protein
VREGGRNVPNLGITSGMPAFGDRLSDDQIVVVIEYSRIFWEPDQRDF